MFKSGVFSSGRTNDVSVMRVDESQSYIHP